MLSCTFTPLRLGYFGFTNSQICLKPQNFNQRLKKCNIDFLILSIPIIGTFNITNIIIIIITTTNVYHCMSLSLNAFFSLFLSINQSLSTFSSTIFLTLPSSLPFSILRPHLLSSYPTVNTH